ncbi:MAG: lysophospholipase [Candidatus Omnitrophota bacterium]
MQTMKTDEKTGVMYRRWQARSPRAVFLLVHGLGAHSGRWEFLSFYFIQNNISSYAIELKGFGETRGLRGHIDSLDIYQKDVRSLYDIATKENPGKKIFLIGESMGALITLLAAISQCDLFEGLVCISPAFVSRIKFSVLDYLKITALLIFNSKKQIKLPFNSKMCTQDAQYQRAMDGDLREHRLVTPKLLTEIAKAQLRTLRSKSELKVPVLFQLAEADSMVSPEASKKVFKGLAVKDKRMITYPGMRHALSIELERYRVFEDILKWLDGRI